MKRLYFISTGRCGTHRIHELLQCKLPGMACVHHFPGSRLVYVLGNMLFYFGGWEWLNRAVFRLITRNGDRCLPLVSADGRILMMFPQSEVTDSETGFIHVEREHRAFARSMFNFSRKNWGNLIAHNCLPFWQLYLWPFENLLSRNVLTKYEKISRRKNEYFERTFSASNHYVRVRYEELFKPGRISGLVNEFFGTDIEFSPAELETRANASTRPIVGNPGPENTE